MTEAYFIVPRIGTGTADDPIAPKYLAEMDLRLDPTGVTGYNVRQHIDDPDLAGVPGGEALYSWTDPQGPDRAWLITRPDSVFLGDDVVEARNQLIAQAQTDSKKADMIASVGGTVADIDRSLTVRQNPIGNPSGTDITDFTDPDTTLWSALSNFPLTKVHLSGTDGSTTFDVLSNQGQAVSTAGGGAYQTVDLQHQTGDNAEDQTVKVHHISGQASNVQGLEIAGRIVVGDTDTCYVFENHTQGGSDTRLHRVVGGVFTVIATDGQVRIVPGRFLKIQIATDGTSVDIDGTVWSDAGAEPAPQITHTDATPGVLDGASGYGGVIFKGERNAVTQVIDDLEFTNNDPPPPSTSNPPGFGAAISRATSGQPVFGARQENVS